MMRILNNVLGHYTPAFFCISVKTDSGDINEIFKEKLHILVHEYVHSLQDISTTASLGNFNSLVDVMLDYMKQARDSSPNPFKPLKIKHKDHNIDNKLLFSKYAGTKKLLINDAGTQKVILTNDIKEIKEVKLSVNNIK